MASSAKPNLLDDGVVDTLVSVRVMSDVTLPFASTPPTARESFAQLFEDLVKERV
jgi:hypothetical protein